MKCHVCGSHLEPTVTDLPFKRDVHSIVVVKELPVLQCAHCGEYLLDDHVMAWVETALDKVDPATEIEVLSYAA